MVVITCNLTADIGPMEYLSDVFSSWWDLQKEARDTDVILLSGSHEARVHRAVLHGISPFLHGLVHQATPSCLCSTPAITLPKVQGDTLAALVELAYTGRSKVESKKAKEEFAELTELLQVGLDVQYEESSSHEREEPNQVAAEATVASTVVKTADEKAAADTSRKDEEKAAADKHKKDLEKAAAYKQRKDDEKTAADKRRKDDETAAADKRRKDEEKAAADKQKKDLEKVAERRKNDEKTAADKRRKDDEKAAADKRRKDEENPATTMKKIDQKGKATSLKDQEAGFEKAETEVIAVLVLKTNVENEPAAENEKEGKKTDATKKIKMMEKTESVEFSKLIDEASSVKVDEARQTRGRKSRGSTVPETETIPFLTSVNQNRRDKSPDSILAKTTRNQKRKIQTILNVHDEMDATPETKTERIDLCIEKTEERFDNIQDIIANKSTDANLFEDDVNENNNGMAQNPIKVNAANDSIEELLENSQMSILSDGGFLLDGSRDGWDKETETSDQEAKLVCPFCKKKFQKKGRYDNHLSWNHFQEEISEKFPGLECPACKRRFVKKSNYVSHLGSFHKVIEGLMAVAFQDKMALIREAQQRKLFASPKHEGGDGVWVETPGGKNASTPNRRQKTSLCKKEAEESSKITNAVTEVDKRVMYKDEK